ncbi:Menaquinol oxidase (H(+)-transporting) [Lentibacillus sp. JNUCC-1]|uniref:cytochrome c oxidase subunit II n=1 Tax=Lentibacillus sp. JNUCC-1 TaxID=2654513 RepID=UPI0012E8FFE4|nr:cytochrome c oxidase subunit II [Lentibacillus sp. JNUCC-1]MUV36344.1 Menaquinol oxidase (H(+)-transporting) [Lentibacillus sp. JNUCC-1]
MKRLMLLSFVFLLSGCSDIAVLNPKSVTGQEQAYLIWLSLGIMTLVILVVFVLFAWFTFKYRYTKNKDGFVPTDVKGNLKLELTWTIIPFVLLAILAVPTIMTTYDHSPELQADNREGADKEGTHINVTGQQFTWTFEYENGKTVHDELIIPEDETIVFHITSKDVIHSFWIPELAGKVDAVPGRVYTYEIKDAERGTYRGKCAEYCGIQHTNMVFNTEVVSKSDYEDYLKKPDNQDD